MFRPGPLHAALAVVAGALLAGAPAAQARTVSQWHQVVAYSPSSVDANVGWLAQQMFDLRKPARIRVGATTYIGPWNNATVGRGTMSETLKELDRRYASDNVAVYSDRRLTATERRRYRVGTSLYRDADVLVLSAGHPACAGLTLAQVRGIARGTITRWSQVVPGVDGRIDVRFPQRNGAAELRFGTRLIRYRTSKGLRYRPSYAQGARGSADGGVLAAGRGDRSIAAITSWSAAGARGGSTCVVPLGGVAASRASVAALRFPSAYPVDVVVRRRVGDPYVRKLIAGFCAYMKSAKVRDQLRDRGLLVAGDPVPADPPPQPSPADVPPVEPIPVNAAPPGAVYP